MATQFYDKKVYIVMLDEIKKDEVPTEKVAWWIDINERQCIDGYKYADIPHLVEDFSHSLGIQTHEDKMNKIIARYNELYHAGRITEAEACLAEYLRGVSLKGKVQLIAHMFSGSLPNTTLASPAKAINERLPKPLLTHTEEPRDLFTECKQITVHDDVFTVANHCVFHRGTRGDAHVIWIWKNDELIHTIYSLVEAYKLSVFLDSCDEMLYIVYNSDKEIFEDGRYIDSITMTSITTVEIQNTQPICSDFKFIE